MNTSFLESFILEKMSETGLPGLSIAIIKGNDIVYARGFGQRDLSSGLAATPDTVYSIASVTKSFTALAILQLAEQAKLTLDDDIRDYLDFKIQPKGQKIQIKHLLSHSSGIPSLSYAEALITYVNNMGGKPLAISGPKDIMTFATDIDAWVETKPGKRWFYFNAGYAMLGQIVEDISGQDYNDYIYENILEPLEMKRSFFAKKDVDILDDVATPYNIFPNKSPEAGNYLYRSIRSEGGLITSVTDLAKYISMYLMGGKGIISKISLKEMWEPRIAMPWYSSPKLLALRAKAKPVADYCYGLIKENFYGENLIGHSGNVGVATAQISFLPEKGVGVAILTNGSGYATSQFAKVALANYLKKDISKLPFMHTETSLNKLTGNYETYKGTMQASIIKHADFLKLLIHYGEQSEEHILVPERLTKLKSEFFTLRDGNKLAISFFNKNKTIEFIYEQYKFKRLGPLV